MQRNDTDTTDTASVEGDATATALADRHQQRRALLAAGFPVVPALPAASQAEARRAVEIMGTPAVFKARRRGIGSTDGSTDGDTTGDASRAIASRGIRFVRSRGDVDAAFAELDQPVLVEPLLGVSDEIVVLVARRCGGEAVAYPPIRTIHTRGVRRIAEAPSGLGAALEAEATGLALAVAEHVGGVGIVAVEMFVVGGALAVNEVVAGPHPSGHLTDDACATSQFENHRNALLDRPLGSTCLVVSAATTAYAPAGGGDPDRAGGHVTVTGSNWEETRREAVEAARELAASTAVAVVA
ncbi:MAG TPA: ATP-grasp domain-containing protein [Acidimicrobiales bacterium]|nr:ATP-grasp domain-containing protein [Acidimicrobiales bacterium]